MDRELKCPRSKLSHLDMLQISIINLTQQINFAIPFPSNNSEELESFVQGASLHREVGD